MGIIAALVLLLGFITGPKNGVIKIVSSVVAHLIAIPLAGISYQFLASLFSFLPGENWDNFTGFFATKYLIILILYLTFVFLAKRFIKKDWNKGIVFRLVGGSLTSLNSAMGMVTLTLAVGAFPFSEWFERVVSGSGFLDWLVTNLGFIKAMLPFS